MEDKVYRIGEVVELTGLTHRTLRYYEELGLLGERRHPRGKFRTYTSRDLERIQNIRQLKESMGFSLNQIKDRIQRGESMVKLLEEARKEKAPTLRAEKFEKARDVLQAELDVVTMHLKKLKHVERRIKEQIAAVNKELGSRP